MQAQQIEVALNHIPAIDAGMWFRMGYAVKSELGDAGFPIWDRWSAAAKNYEPKAAASMWRSVKPRQGGITIASLYHEARQ